MEKAFKYFLSIFSIALVIGIIYAIHAPKPQMSIFDEQEMRQLIVRLNEDLPREIGTIGYLDSITYSNHTISYIMSVKGDNGIKQVYTEYYDNFKDLLKYSVLMMNDQRNMGQKFSSILDSKGLDAGVKIYTPDGTYTSWTITGTELKNFVDGCRLNPTEALHRVIEMEVKIANLTLPMKPGEGSSVRTVTLNSIESDDEAGFLLLSIAYIGNSLVLEYDVDEHENDLNLIDENATSIEYIETLASIMAEDADVSEFFGLVSIAHTNIVLKCIGRTSKKVVEITIPYHVIKKYCKVPSYLLS